MPLGSYLAVCVFYATFFGESPVGLPAKLTTAGGEVLVELPEAQARLVQGVAWDVVQKYRSVSENHYSKPQSDS